MVNMKTRLMKTQSIMAVSEVLRTLTCRITADIRHITQTRLITMENIRMMIAAVMIIHIITIITTGLIIITQICLCVPFPNVGANAGYFMPYGGANPNVSPNQPSPNQVFGRPEEEED